jgi:starch phosphorylase
MASAPDVPFAAWPGRRDLAAAANALASRIPPALAPLARLAYTYRWSWLPGGEDVFAAIDPYRWQLCGGNPVRLLEETSALALDAATDDRALMAEAGRLEARVIDDLARPPGTPVIPADRPVAFLCAEFAVHGSLPIYSGGLGALAGDLLKQASDSAVPMVGVGLMYRQGYFRQRIDISGWQHEYWIDTDPERLVVTVPIRAGARLMDVVRVLDAAGVDAVDVHRREATLDDVFLTLTRRVEVPA